MPVYEYRCTSCQKEFEYEHRMSEKRTECEACKGALERLISRTAFQFKGGGWYKDLYASPKPESMSGTAPPAASSSSEPASKPANDAGSSTPSSPSSGSSGSSGSGSGSSGGTSGGSSTSGVAAAS